MGTMMDVKYEITEDILIARLSGELDHHSAAGIREDIDQAVEAFRALKLILLLDQITFMDSAGIGVVMGRYNKMKGRRGKLFLAGGGEYIRKILGMAGVYTIIKHYDTAQEAVDSIIHKDIVEKGGGDNDSW